MLFYGECKECAFFNPDILCAEHGDDQLIVLVVEGQESVPQGTHLKVFETEAEIFLKFFKKDLP